jgi:hypothetical protein
MKFYLGVGSRETPSHIQRVMTSLAMELSQEGYWLRSGNAYGADYAFANGAFDKAQIWLPWKEYNIEHQLKFPTHTYKVIQVNDTEAYESVIKFHPSPSKLGTYGTKLMARNFRQCVGLNEPNSQFGVCWTPNGEITGGTGQAMRISLHYNIPMYNLFSMTKDEILREVKKLNLLQ